MSARRPKLTRRLVEGVSAGPKDVFVWDSDVIGFGLRVRAGGHRGYILQYRLGGRARRYQIGAHGSPWTVETARDRARVLMGQIAGGEDPLDLKIASRAELTVTQLCDLHLAEGLATRKESSVTAARADIENHIKPLLGTRRASLVVRQDIDHLLAAVAAGKTQTKTRTGKKKGLSRVRGGKGAANSSVQTISAAFGFAVARGIRHDNPAFRVRRFPEKKLERFLSPAEIARLGEALAAAEAVGVMPRSAIAAIRLLVLTGCRKNEILTLKPAYVDRHHRCLRLPDSKTGHKIVHIGAPALKVIADIHPEGWLAIALHTTNGVSAHVEPMAALLAEAANMDLIAAGYDDFTPAERNAVETAFPREPKFAEGFLQVLYDGLRHRPETTQGTGLADVMAYKDPAFRRRDFSTLVRASRWTSKP